MFDALRDQPGAVAERDLIGDEANPAGFRAADSQFFYLRMRLDADPAPGNTPRPFAWGFALDLDDDPSDYEALVVLDGNSGQIALHRNTQTTVPDSPADPADVPPLATAAYAQRGRTVQATGSAFSGPGDSFLDLAIPWTDLALVNVTPTTPVRVWVGTSTNPDRLDDDIACHQGGTGGGPSLTGTATPPAAVDPNAPGGGADFGTGGPGQSRAFEGGPGCAMAGTSAAGGLFVALALLLLVSRARRSGSAGRGS